MVKNKKDSFARRDFLKASGIVGAAAGIAAISLKGTSVKAAKLKEKSLSGYKETAHVKKYYELARF